MGSADDEALSDLEDDGPPPVLTKPPLPSLVSVLAELETERQARKAAEAAKAELVMRFKTYTQDALRQKEEIVKQKDEEAHNLREELSRQLSDAIRQRDEIAHQRDEMLRMRDDAWKQRDDANRARDSSRSEIEIAARLLVEGADKVTNKVSAIKAFPGNLPRSPQHTGVAAIAYGYTKRAEEIVEELVRQHEVAIKGRSELREQMEQHNYRMAIEVSEMEASIQSLKQEVSQKSSESEKWKKLASDKEAKVAEIEHDFSMKIAESRKQSDELKLEAQDVKNKIQQMKELVVQLSGLISKGKEVVTNFVELAPSNVPSETNSCSIRAEPEESLQDCLTRLKELVEACSNLGASFSEQRKNKQKEVNDLEDTVAQLKREKEEITGFLRNALANKQELSKFSEDGRNEPAVISMASALENEVKTLRQHIFELQQSLASARGEVEHFRMALDRREKEVIQRDNKIRNLEEKQTLAVDQIEALNMDLIVAQEEISRWKETVAREAEARSSISEEVESSREEISTLKKQCEQLAQSLEESNSKLHSKEEMTMAAIAARNAAERSLRIADERAVQLRERVEELNKQFDALERISDGGISGRLYNICWPHGWFRGSPLFPQGNRVTQPSAEMGELFEPLVDQNP